MVVPVSVVIPCYQNAGTIGRALQSVVKQTARPAEVILVDDASDDGTYEVICGQRDSLEKGWVTVIRLSKNCGPATARNVGWDSSKSDLIAFLDADDSWHPEKIATQYSCMKSRPEIALSGHYSKQYAASDHGSSVKGESLHVSRITRRRLLCGNPFRTSSVVMLRRQIGIRFDPHFRFCQDGKLWLEVAYAGWQLALIKATLSYYYKPLYGSAGQTADIFAARNAQMRIYRELREKQLISTPLQMALQSFSWVRHIKRRLVHSSRTMMSSR